MISSCKETVQIHLRDMYYDNDDNELINNNNNNNNADISNTP